MVTEIRLIIFFAAKDGEALYSQQKQDQEQTVAQIMNSLLPNSDLKWRKWGKPLDHSSEVAQSCPTLCNLMDCSPPGSSVHGIHQARIQEWISISFSRGIFPTQGSNPSLPHRRQMLYHLQSQPKGRELHFFFLGMVLITIQCHEPPSIVLQALCLSDLIPWIYLTLPLYNFKGFDLGHTWMI